MKRIFLLSFVIAGTLNLAGQNLKEPLKKQAFQMLFFLDSIKIHPHDIQKIDKDDIAEVNIKNSFEGRKLYGEDGRDGVMYIFTKHYAKSKYWAYFQSKSRKYKKLITSPEKDSAVQYILNKKKLKTDIERTLFLINDTDFKRIRLLKKKKLKNKFKVFDKELGFQIKVAVPKKSKEE